MVAWLDEVRGKNGKELMEYEVLFPPGSLTSLTHTKPTSYHSSVPKVPVNHKHLGNTMQTKHRPKLIEFGYGHHWRDKRAL